jgi:site-specific DNA-adenine methylase
MGCKVVISNSSAHSLRAIYWEQGFNIYEIQAARLVSAKSAGRTPVTEIVVTNFEVSHPSLKLVSRT